MSFNFLSIFFFTVDVCTFYVCVNKRHCKKLELELELEIELELELKLELELELELKLELELELELELQLQLQLQLKNFSRCPFKAPVPPTLGKSEVISQNVISNLSH